jgi:O-acetyl-ADP-ribose deacetylase (regulator of RNase III)
MIRYVRGNLLDSNAEALVNAVNCVGVMGKGIALAFKERYPDMFREYARKCRREEMQPGSVWARRWGHGGPHRKWVACAATKNHWRDPSHLSDIELCAARLRAFVKAASIKSIAVPALGCGNGGLKWEEVRPLLENALGDLNADVEIYEP